MTHKIVIHKGKEQFPNSMWWRTPYAWQKQMSEALRGFFPFIPAEFWDTEETMFSFAQKNISRVFGEAFNNRQMATPWWNGAVTEPYIDILEAPDEFIVKADLPGTEADNIDLSFAGRALIIKGENSAGEKIKNARYIRRECCSGAFSRVIALPENANLANASASFERNVLTVTIPKEMASAASHTAHRERKAA